MSGVASVLLSLCVRTADSICPIFGQIEAVAPHLRVEKLPVDIEHTCRFGAIAGSPIQGPTDQYFLEPRQCGRQVLVGPGCGFRRARLWLFEKAEVSYFDRLAADEYRHALHCVLQLTDITGPAIPNELGASRGRELLLAAGFGEKILGQGQNIGNALAQWRQVYWDDVQAIEQI